MKQDFQKLLKRYDYKLNPVLIAKFPASPRDSAKLMVISRKSGKFFYSRFSEIGDYLPPKAVLVFNQTKVLPARMILNKESGGKAKVLYLGTNKGIFEFLADRNLKIGSRLFLNNKPVFLVISKDKNIYSFKPFFPAKMIYKILDKSGITPLPPYIKNSPLSEKQLRKEYQAVFAKNLGSVAAPTASLHFTNNLLKKLKKSGFRIQFLTLNVGLGTFAPLTKENIEAKKLFQEKYFIDKKTIDFLNKAKKQGRPIIAVGTTVARTLESAVSSRGFLIKTSGDTDLFIQEGHKFKFIDGVITNFHIPKSSLLMLVSAFVGRDKIMKAYKEAIKRKFRFYSFGDGTIIY